VTLLSREQTCAECMHIDYYMAALGESQMVIGIPFRYSGICDTSCVPLACGLATDRIPRQSAWSRPELRVRRKLEEKIVSISTDIRSVAARALSLHSPVAYDDFDTAEFADAKQQLTANPQQPALRHQHQPRDPCGAIINTSVS
jgi:hypothetical protein